MASCSDSNRPEQRSSHKVTPVPISTSKKLAEPFNRLKNRANLFRRKNYSSQLNISSHSPSSGTDHIVPSDRPSLTSASHHAGVILLKRSNSMIYPQQRLQSLLHQTNSNPHHRNSICVELAGCSTDESSTDDYQFNKSSFSRYWNRQIGSTMSNIDEHEIVSSPLPPSAHTTQSNHHQSEADSKESVSFLPNNNNNNSDHHREERSVVVVIPASSSAAMNVLPREEKENEGKQARSTEQIPLTNPTSLLSSSHLSSSPSPSTVILRDHAEVIRTRRQCHSSISLLQHQQRQQQQQFASSAFEEPFFDCKQLLLAEKPHSNLPMSASKISTCTMTGKSLNNLDDCLSSTSSEEKAVQTTSNEPHQNHSSIKRAMSITSLSSSSAVSIQTDSHEKKSKMPLSTDTDHPTHSPHPTLIPYKWPHLHERLLGEHTCTYWVNYLGSTAIKMSDDGMTAMPAQAIARLKQSTQYARVLPIIGLNISSRGVEFLKHTKDRVVICYHDIKTIHCACQDQDLRYFAYVTREQRLIHGISHAASAASAALDHKQQQHQSPPSPSLSIGGDFHHYCHVFVVKSEAMSTEIMLTFGQVFDLAYRLHRRSKTNGKKSKEIHPMANNDEHHPHLEVIRLSTKSDITNHNGSIMSSSTHSPATSSSSSSIDDRKIFV